MQLIAESGSTKTDWNCIINGKVICTFSSQGLNPYIQSREEINESIKNEVIPQIADRNVKQIYFYGAGCSSEENNRLMFTCLKNFFHQAEILIKHDLLGAARALWGNNSGIVCILGTGSNSCIYDGNEIKEGIPALGYILGDEGSGAYIGKTLVRDYLYKQMPFEISEKLRIEYQLDKDKILNKVYLMPNPNRWLASFSIFVRDNINYEYCRELVRKGFRDFFKSHVSSYSNFKNLPLGAVGSIAFLYQDMLTEVAEEFGFNLEKVIRSPLKELGIYHNQTESVGQ